MAQSDMRLTNHWYDTYLINPGADHFTVGQFNLAGRAQWTGFEGAPFSGYFSGTTSWSHLHSQFGLTAFVDKIGYTTTADVGLAYTFSVPLKKSTFNYNFSVGVKIKYQFLHYNQSKIDYGDSGNESLITERLQDINKPNADVGFEFLLSPSYGTFQFGVSCTNFISLFDKSYDPFCNVNYVYAKYNSEFDGVVNFNVGLMGINANNTYQLEAMAGANFSVYNGGKTSPSARLGLLACYRTLKEIGVGFSAEFSHLQIIYSYEYNFSSIKTTAYGTHELMLIYRLPNCKRCHWGTAPTVRNQWWKNM
ncbi:MAG: type IX secretion system membrane protein PorP/SprF [Paludibacteraceae bacterium]|nr:type IX secretion system membrane protein PorP/SprF [Paludibacteraceae bacterium]